METAAIEKGEGEAFSLRMRERQHRRLRLVSHLVILILLAVETRALVTGEYVAAALVAIILSSILLTLRLNAKPGPDYAAAFALVSLTALLGYSMWSNQGLYSGALIAFPTILVIAGLITSERLFWGLLTLMLITVAVISIAAALGYHSFHPLPMGLQRWMVVSSILLLSAGTIVWLMREMRCMQRSLESEVKRLRCSQAKLTHLAGHDALTGLSNRASFNSHVARMIEMAGQRKGCIAVLYLDIDNFKTINDSLGHSAGDELIQAIASRLSQVVRDADALSRHGADEFVMALADVEDLQTAIRVAQRMQTVISQPFEVNAKQLFTSLSVGIAVFPDDGTDVDTLVRKSEVAMFQAKKAGRNTHIVHQADMASDNHDRLDIEQALRHAIARDELELFYQPIIALRGDRLIGAEALLRWRHPGYGLLGPDRFMDVAEQSGLIVEIGEWVLGQACREAVRWQTEGLKGLGVSVNLSAVQLRRNNLESVVADALASTGLGAAMLELELTESMLLEKSDQFLQLLRSLKQMGVKLAIDDFGTGYSNLSYLQRFQVDRLKIDKSFVSHIGSNEQNRAIVTAVIQMAHSLKLEVTAEGIEHQLVQRILTSLGCDHAQGYLFSRPVEADRFLEFAKAHSSIA